MNLNKTRAIVLRYIKYGDSSIILDTYTKEYGRMSFIVNGVFSKKSKFKINLFQPLFILDLDIYLKPNRDLQRIKELRLAYTFNDLSLNFLKTTLSIFIAEILYKVLRESEKNEGLFSYIEKSIEYLDNQDEGINNFHLLFLMNLTRFIGIYPNTSEGIFSTAFDLKEGVFIESYPGHNQTIPSEMLDAFRALLNRSIVDLPAIQLSRIERAVLLDHLIDYYQIHLQGFGSLNSLPILKEVFAS